MKRSIFNLINHKKLIKLKVILILCFIGLIFPVSLISMVLKDVSVLHSSYNNHIISGNSFFIPFLPNVNLLGFLPEKYQIIQFSLGHLIDIIIIANIFHWIRITVYHYYKKVCLFGEPQLFTHIDSFLLSSIGKILEQSQDSDILFGLRNDLRENLKDKFLNIIERKHRLNERIDSSYDNLSRIRHRNNNIQNRLIHKKYEFFLKTLYKNPQLFCYHSNIEKILIFRSKNHYQYPVINNFTDFNNHFLREGG